MSCENCGEEAEKAYNQAIKDVLKKIERCESHQWACHKVIIVSELKAMLMKGENPFLTPQENNNQLPKSSNKDTSEISQVADESESLNQEIGCDNSKLLEVATLSGCKSSALAPDNPASVGRNGYFETITEGIRGYIKDNYGEPNTIKFNQITLHKLRIKIPTPVEWNTETLFGMRIEIDNSLKEDECIVYNDQNVYRQFKLKDDSVPKNSVQGCGIMFEKYPGVWFECGITELCPSCKPKELFNGKVNNLNNQPKDGEK